MKIADFGLSALVRLDEDGYDAAESSKRKKFASLHEMWGTKEYFAPEVINKSYGPQADVWALGCVLYELLTGRQAFPVQEGDTEKTFYTRILAGKIDMTAPVWKKITPEAKELLGHMLEVDPTKRWSASECLLHRWITGVAHSKEHTAVLHEVGDEMRKRLEARRKRREKKNKKAQT